MKEGHYRAERDDLSAVACAVSLALSRSGSAFGAISQGTALGDRSPTVTATAYLACCC
jgi:hypothetical protein